MRDVMAGCPNKEMRNNFPPSTHKIKFSAQIRVALKAVRSSHSRLLSPSPSQRANKTSRHTCLAHHPAICGNITMWHGSAWSQTIIKQRATYGQNKKRNHNNSKFHIRSKATKLSFETMDQGPLSTCRGNCLVNTRTNCSHFSLQAWVSVAETRIGTRSQTRTSCLHTPGKCTAAEPRSQTFRISFFLHS